MPFFGSRVTHSGYQRLFSLVLVVTLLAAVFLPLVPAEAAATAKIRHYPGWGRHGCQPYYPGPLVQGWSPGP